MKKILEVMVCTMVLLILTVVPCYAAEAAAIRGTAESDGQISVVQKIKDYVAKQDITVRVPAGNVPARAALGVTAGNIGGNAVGAVGGRLTGAAVFPGKIVKSAADAAIGNKIGSSAGEVLGKAILPGDKTGSVVGGLTGAALGVPEGAVLLPGDHIGAAAGKAVGAAHGMVKSLADPVTSHVGKALAVPVGLAEGLGKAVPKLAMVRPLGRTGGFLVGRVAGPAVIAPELPGKWIGAAVSALLQTPLGAAGKTVLLPGNWIGMAAGWTAAGLENAAANFIPGAAATVLGTAAGSLLGKNLGALAGTLFFPMDKILEGVFQIPAVIQGILGAEKGAVLGLALGLPSAPLGYFIGSAVGHLAGLIVGPPLGAFGGATTGGAIGAVIGFSTGALLGIPSFTSWILAPIGAAAGYAIWAVICAPIWFVVGAFNGRAVCGIIGKVVGAGFGMVVEAMIGATCGYILGRFLATIPVAVPAMLAKALGSAIDAFSGAVLGELLGLAGGLTLGTVTALTVAGFSFIPKALLSSAVGAGAGTLLDAVLGAALTAVPAGLIGFTLGNGVDLAVSHAMGSLIGAGTGKTLAAGAVVVPSVLKAEVKDRMIGGVLGKTVGTGLRTLIHGAAGAGIGRLLGTVVDMQVGSVSKGLCGVVMGTVLGSALDGVVGAGTLGTLFATLGALRGFVHGIIFDMASGALLGRPMLGVPSTVIGGIIGAELAKLHQKLTGENTDGSWLNDTRLGGLMALLKRGMPKGVNAVLAFGETDGSRLNPGKSDGAKALKTEDASTETESQKQIAVSPNVMIPDDTGAKPDSVMNAGAEEGAHEGHLGRPVSENGFSGYGMNPLGGIASTKYSNDAVDAYPSQGDNVSEFPEASNADLPSTGDVGFEIAASLLLAVAAMLAFAWRKESKEEYIEL